MRQIRAGVLGVLAGLWASGAALPGQGAARTSPVPRLVLHLRWDESAKRTTWELVTHFPIESVEAMKARVRPIAREFVDPRTDFSVVPITIVCNKKIRFRNVKDAMTVCSDKEVQIYLVRLETEKECTPDGGSPQKPGRTTTKETPHSGPFAIRLTMRNGTCACRTNGWPIGDLPGARKVLAMQLQRAAKLEMPVEITRDGDVPEKLVVGVVDDCMEAKVAAITFAGKVRARPQKK